MSETQLEKVLEDLNIAVSEALTKLKGPLKQCINQHLHDPDKLPSKRLHDLTLESIDKLHEARQILEPKTLILAEHFMWYANCKCLNAAVELQVPEVLQKAPQTIESLARECQARPDRLQQVMRVLHADGIFEYDPISREHSNNECSTLLLRDHWTGWWSWVDLYGNEFYDMARGIPQSVRAGETRMPSQIQFDTDDSMFTWFAKQGSLHRVHRTLGGGAIAQAPGITKDYPWHEIAPGVIIDIGGGGGGLISSLMSAYPDLHGGVFDRPEVIEQAKTNFHTPDGMYSKVGKQVREENLHAGSFFEEIPAYETYCIKFCLHDWNDEDCIKILKNIRRAIKPGPKSRLIVLEIMLRPGRSGQLSRMGDMSVMMAANGFEREEHEWKMLAQKSGWKIERTFTLRNAWPTAMEWIPA